MSCCVLLSSIRSHGMSCCVLLSSIHSHGMSCCVLLLQRKAKYGRLARSPVQHMGFWRCSQRSVLLCTSQLFLVQPPDLPRQRGLHTAVHVRGTLLSLRLSAKIFSGINQYLVLTVLISIFTLVCSVNCSMR